MNTIDVNSQNWQLYFYKYSTVAEKDIESVFDRLKELIKHPQVNATEIDAIEVALCEMGFNKALNKLYKELAIEAQSGDPFKFQVPPGGFKLLLKDYKNTRKEQVYMLAVFLIMPVIYAILTFFNLNLPFKLLPLFGIFSMLSGCMFLFFTCVPIFSRVILPVVFFIFYLFYGTFKLLLYLVWLCSKSLNA